jgi:hypothetical protein
LLLAGAGCEDDGAVIFQPCETPDDCAGMQVNTGQWESFEADPLLCVVDPYGGGEPFCTTRCENANAGDAPRCMSDPVCDPGCCYINLKSGKQGICVPYAPAAAPASNSTPPENPPDDQDGGR